MQLKSFASIEQRILSCACVGESVSLDARSGNILDVPSDHRAADALLFVSGSHPVRSIPGFSRWANLATYEFDIT